MQPKSDASASVSRTTAHDFMPKHRSVESLRLAEQTCRGCDLYRRATQAVGGEGPTTARLVLVGECPGMTRTKEAGRSSGPRGS